MIYTFIRTVTPRRLEEAKTRADRVIELEEASHRDPSGVIPAMASSIRTRSFNDAAVREAATTDRLRVVEPGGLSLPECIANEIHHLRQGGCHSVGIFETTNAGAATLGAELAERGIDHSLIGLPEAHGEALLAMGMLGAYGLGGISFDDTRRQLAVFLTAATRSSQPPVLAQQLLTDSLESPVLRKNLETIRQSLEAEEPQGLLTAVSSAWEALGITTGRATWKRAARAFSVRTRALVARDVRPDELAADLLMSAEQQRNETLMSEDGHLANVQVMNFHQTKGREADGVILVYREGGFVTGWQEREPFTEPSRVLYVALTRARFRVSVVLPPNPHPLIAPLTAFLKRP